MRKKYLFIIVLVLFFIISYFLYSSSSKIVYSDMGELSVPVPIIMYHSLSTKPSKLGRYVVSPEILEQDMKYIQQKGYTTVFVSDMVDYVYSGKALPEKPIVITFDDGNYNNLTYALPLLKKYNMKAVISVVGDYIDKSTKEDDHNPNYSYATWQEITQAATTGHIEFGNHTYSMHSLSPRNGAGKKRGEDSSAYQNALEQDLSKLQDALEANCNLRPIVFAYPFDNISDDSFEVIKKLGFRASLSCRERVSKVDPFDTGSLYLLGRYNRPAGIETADFFKRMLE